MLHAMVDAVSSLSPNWSPLSLALMAKGGGCTRGGGVLWPHAYTTPKQGWNPPPKEG